MRPPGPRDNTVLLVKPPRPGGLVTVAPADPLTHAAQARPGLRDRNVGEGADSLGHSREALSRPSLRAFPTPHRKPAKSLRSSPYSSTGTGNWVPREADGLAPGQLAGQEAAGAGLR